MKIVATKYNYDVVQGLDILDIFEELDEDQEYLRTQLELTPDGEVRLICNENFELLPELKRRKILEDLLTKYPNNNQVKLELLLVSDDKDLRVSQIEQYFSREKAHIEKGLAYEDILSMTEVRIVVLKLSEFYSKTEDIENHRNLLKWTVEKGFNNLAEEIVTDIHQLESSLPSMEEMMQYDELNFWTHNLLISDLFDGLNTMPYDMVFIDLINWQGTHFNHDLYLKILDSNREHILHDVTWLFYQNLIAYRNGENVEGVSGILVILNFINHFELRELVGLITETILTMSEKLYNSMVYDIERAFFDGPLVELMRLDGEMVIDTLTDPEILGEIEIDFIWYVLSPFFRAVASLSKQENEEGSKFEKYFRQLHSYFSNTVSEQYLLGEGEDFNYSSFKDIIDPAYENGIMNPGIFGDSPRGEHEALLPLTYDKKNYFKKLDKDWDTDYTKMFDAKDLEKLESELISVAENKLKNQSQSSFDYQDDFNPFDEFYGEEDEDDETDEDDLFWLSDLPEGNKKADIIPITFKRENPKVGRNDPCPCGSGKKYKKCCLNKDQ